LALVVAYGQEEQEVNKQYMRRYKTRSAGERGERRELLRVTCVLILFRTGITVTYVSHLCHTTTQPHNNRQSTTNTHTYLLVVGNEAHDGVNPRSSWEIDLTNRPVNPLINKTVLIGVGAKQLGRGVGTSNVTSDRVALKDRTVLSDESRHLTIGVDVGQVLLGLVVLAHFEGRNIDLDAVVLAGDQGLEDTRVAGEGVDFLHTHKRAREMRDEHKSSYNIREEIGKHTKPDMLVVGEEEEGKRRRRKKTKKRIYTHRFAIQMHCKSDSKPFSMLGIYWWRILR
jgi:hypothetical protein